MRIIAGEKRRLTLKCPPGERTRPTTGRVRESLFGILTPWLEEARVLDLFAGAGTLGLEALSRGASEAIFVESHKSALDTLAANLARLELTTQAKIVRADARRFLERPPSQPFDLIFADPPYGEALGVEVMERLADRPTAWLSPAGRVILQTGRHDPVAPGFGDLHETLRREYGETAIHIFDWVQASPTNGG